jgi:hypothetical protein
MWKTDLPVSWMVLVDVGLVGFLAWHLNRKSRLAAIGLVAYFIVVGLLQWIEYGAPPIAGYIILAYFLGRAVPATFRWHRSAPSGTVPHGA